MESGQNLCTGRFWAVFFFVFGVSEQLESSIGCRIRLRALMNLGGGPTEGPPSPAAAPAAARRSDAPRPQPPRRSTRNAATQTPFRHPAPWRAFRPRGQRSRACWPRRDPHE